MACIEYIIFNIAEPVSVQFIVFVFIFCFSDKRPEQSIAAARASVMVYDDVNKKWVPAGSSHGLSKVAKTMQ